MLILNHRQLLRDVIHRYFAASAAFYRHYTALRWRYSTVLRFIYATAQLSYRQHTRPSHAGNAL